MGTDHARMKQVVTDALTAVLRRSRFRDWLDADAFSRTLDAKFDVLYIGGALDLVPLWESLAAAYSPHALVGLFLRFRAEGERLGVPTRIPEIIDRLTDEQRRAHLEHFDLVADLAEVEPSAPRPEGAMLRTADLTPLPTLASMDVTGDPIPLSSADLRPIIPEDVKRRVITAVVQCVKGSPAGWRVNSGQLRQYVTMNFEALCDGIRFDFDPIMTGLLADDGVSEADAYVAFVRLAEQLRLLNVAMDEPALSLGDAAKARLAEEAIREKPAERPVSDLGDQPLPGQKTVRLGELLVRYQLISVSQLDQALQNQRVAGGKLGTNLVELGFLEESALTHFLSIQLNIPAMSPGDLDKIAPEVLSILPAEIAKKYGVIPLAAHKRKLRLAMIDPTDLAVIDEVSFTTGHRVEPVVAAETLIQYALERYYGVPRTERRRLDLQVAPAPEDEFQVIHVQAAKAKAARTPPPVVGTPAPAMSVHDTETIPIVDHPAIVEDRSDFLAFDRHDLSDAGAFGEYVAALVRAGGAGDIHRAVLDALSRLFERVALFGLQGAEVVGMGQVGCAVTDEQLVQSRFALQGSELFRILATVPRLQLGPAPASPYDAWILGGLGIPAGAPILGVPIIEGQRIVSFAIAAGRRRGDVYQDVRTYERVAEKAALAFQMVALRRQILQG